MRTKPASTQHADRPIGSALLAAFVSVFVSLFVFGATLPAQEPYDSSIKYDRGQDVSPVFNGWESNPDGTFSMWFGYYDRNTQEEVDVPLGPQNNFDLGNGDQGQPTHFYPGVRWWVFKVIVPKDWPKDKRLVWTLTNRGRTNVSKAWLEPEWQVDKLVISADGAGDRFTGSLGRPLAYAIIAGDQAPVITGNPTETTTLPSVADLSVTVTDDGLPQPRPADERAGGQGGREEVTGVSVRWILYRGPGNVQFDPDLSPTVYGKPLISETKVRFSVPGNYRIRAIARDQALFSTYDIDVTVKPVTSTGETQ